MTENITTVAIDILNRATLTIGAQYSKNPSLIKFLWNHESLANKEVREAIFAAQAYAKEDADCYAKIACIDAEELYTAIDMAAEQQRNNMYTDYCNKLMKMTCFELTGKLYHVIGKVKDISDKVVKNHSGKELDLVSITVDFENNDTIDELTLTFWDEDAINAFCTFQIDDIICVDGTIHKRRYGTKWYTNYTAQKFSMFATATPEDYMPSENYDHIAPDEPSDRQYDVRIWGRRGHYRRTPKGDRIIYVQPCVCHRNPAYEVAVEQF